MRRPGENSDGIVGWHDQLLMQSLNDRLRSWRQNQFPSRYPDRRGGFWIE
jgi:hypothetical protein